MGREEWHLHNQHFKSIFDRSVEKNRNFDITYTNYTKKIDFYDGSFEKMFFSNKDVPEELRNYQLVLINKVRRDAKYFVDNYNKSEIPKADYIRLCDIPNDTMAFKIDLNGAYWQYAINNNIISEDTNRYFNSIKIPKGICKKYNKTQKQIKKDLRLRALGSLATTRIKEYWRNGKCQGSEAKTEPTQPIYKDICRGIDDLMKDIHNDFHLFFYWVDCCFSDTRDDIVNFLWEQNYPTTVEEKKLDTIDIDGEKWIVSKDPEKIWAKPDIYSIRKEEYELIDSIKRESNYGV